jgi:hypothetical protein
MVETLDYRQAVTMEELDFVLKMLKTEAALA